MSRENHNKVKELGFSLLSEGTTIKIRADGYSMFPVIKAGNIIYVEPVTDDLFPVPGEIIAWKRETGLVVHRLIKIIREEHKELFITRGDSCANEDPPVLKDQIAGKVIRVERGSGKKKVSENRLIHKPDYLYNRLLVWIIIRLKKIRNFVKQI